MHRKKRVIGVLLVVAAALAAALSVLQYAAAAAPVFDSTVLSGYKYATATSDNFSLVSPAPRDKVVIDLPGESLIVENKSCSTGRRFQACYKGATFKGYNHSLIDREVYEFKITISLVAPEIKVAKALDKVELDVADSALISVNITNIGSAQGAVFFTETVPGQLKIIELPDQPCQISANNTLIMAVDLKDGEIRKCNYKVTALVPGTFTLSSAASYDAIKRETAAATVSLTVKPLPLLLNEAVMGKLLLGESFNLSLELRPSSKLDSFVFSAFIPGGIKVASVAKEVKDVTLDSSVPFERQKGGVKVIYGDLYTPLNGTVKISVLGEAVAVGTASISANASWLFNGLKQSMVKDILVNVTLAKPYIRLEKYDNETGEASLEVVNPAHLAIYDVAVIPDTAPENEAFSAGSIGSSGHVSFVDTPKPPQPASNASGSPGLNYTGKIVYHTIYGQELSAPFSLMINSSIAMAAANDTGVTEMKPAAGQDEPDNTANATDGEIIKREKPPKRKLMAAEIKTALVMVAIIIVMIGLFFVIRARRGSSSEETDSEDEELRKLRGGL